MEKGTPAWKKYTTPGCEGCDNYQVWSDVTLAIEDTDEDDEDDEDDNEDLTDVTLVSVDT